MEVAIAIIILIISIMGILWEVFYYNGIQIITRFSSQEVPHSGKLRSTLHNCPNDVCAAYEKFNFFLRHWYTFTPQCSWNLCVLQSYEI